MWAATWQAASAARAGASRLPAHLQRRVCQVGPVDLAGQRDEEQRRQAAPVHAPPDSGTVHDLHGSGDVTGEADRIPSTCGGGGTTADSCRCLVSAAAATSLRICAGGAAHTCPQEVPGSVRIGFQRGRCAGQRFRAFRGRETGWQEASSTLMHRVPGRNDRAIKQASAGSQKLLCMGPSSGARL